MLCFLLLICVEFIDWAATTSSIIVEAVSEPVEQNLEEERPVTLATNENTDKKAPAVQDKASGGDSFALVAAGAANLWKIAGSVYPSLHFSVLCFSIPSKLSLLRVLFYPQHGGDCRT